MVINKKHSSKASSVKSNGGSWETEVRYKRKDTPAIQKIVRYTKQLAKHLFVRREASTNFCGGPCVRIPEPVIKQEWVENAPRLQESLNMMATKDGITIFKKNQARLERHLKAGNMGATFMPLAQAGTMQRYQFRVCVNLPRLLLESRRNIQKDLGPLKFTQRELRAQGIKRGDDDVSYLKTEIFEIINSSTKLMRIKQLWFGDGKNPAIRDATDYRRKPSRVILSSQLAVCNIALFNVSTHRRPLTNAIC
jgi:hypothetical protein